MGLCSEKICYHVHTGETRACSVPPDRTGGTYRENGRCPGGGGRSS
nr:MAG TPA: hypothetical protein [Caudoviricetes sp.]